MDRLLRCTRAIEDGDVEGPRDETVVMAQKFLLPCADADADDLDIVVGCIPDKRHHPPTSHAVGASAAATSATTTIGGGVGRRLPDISRRFTIIRKLGSGTFGSVLLAESLCSGEGNRGGGAGGGVGGGGGGGDGGRGTRLALKRLPKTTTKLDDFVREFNYSRQLSSHASVVRTFDVAFETRSSYVFAQEWAAGGDLLQAVTPRRGLAEAQAKAVVRQVVRCIFWPCLKVL